MHGPGTNRLVRIIAFVSGLVVVVMVSGALLSDFGPRGLAVALGAVLGTLIAILASEALFRRVMAGVASIIGGIVGSMLGESVVSDSRALTHSGIAVGPYLVFVGSVLGGAVWIAAMSIIPFNRKRRRRSLIGKCQHATGAQEQASEYLMVSLGALVIGPVLGMGYFLIEYVGGNVGPLDEWPVLGYAIRGPVGALLCATSFGAIGGLLFGVPYFMAWLMRLAAQRGKPCFSFNKGSEKKPPQGCQWTDQFS